MAKKKPANTAKAKAAVDQFRQACEQDGRIEAATLQIGDSQPVTIYERQLTGDAQPGDIDSPADGGSRSQKDLWREYVSGQMLDQVMENEELKAEMREREETLSEARTAAREQEKLVVAGEAKLTALALDMVKIERGTYTPPLFDAAGNVLATPKAPHQADSSGPVRPDPGETDGFEALGLSDSVRSKLEESQLAKEVKLKTVADLERAIAADEWWHRKIKGMGLTNVEKVIDAIVSYRATFPVPVADDGRRKQCTDPDCQQHHTRGIFVESFTKGAPDECPQCGNTKFWQLVDPAELQQRVQHPLDTLSEATDAVLDDGGEEE